LLQSFNKLRPLHISTLNVDQGNQVGRKQSIC
jgi:hypothetical protein